MIRWGAFALGAACLLALALWIRLPLPGARPVHGDEAVHMVKFSRLWLHGDYRYDPNEYHGPTLYYATLPVVSLLGRRTFEATHEGDYRLVTILFGAAMVLCPLLMAPCTGRRSALAGAALLAVSPVLVYYSRYYIQETLLAAFSLVLLASVIRYRASGSRSWAVAAGIASGLMLATKETAPLSFVAVAVAAVSLPRPVGPVSETRRRLLLDLALGTVCAIVVAAWFLSGGSKHVQGPIDLLRSYVPWIGRAGGRGLHAHTWFYYIGLLVSGFSLRGGLGEWFVAALFVAGSAVAWRRADAYSIRGVSLYTLVLLALYSIVPYKTPWCVVGVAAPMCLVAGDLVARIGGRGKGLMAALVPVLILLPTCGALAQRSWVLSVDRPAAASNPYAYAQPVPDVVQLGQRVLDLAASSPEGDRTLVKVISDDEYYWPLPWYIRRLRNVGYWTRIPSNASAPIVLASPSFDEELTRRLDPTHLMTGFYGLRPGAMFQVWVRMDTWTRYLGWRKRQPGYVSP